MRHLVLLSGGPDSALALKEVLTTTQDPVAALHVSLRDPLGRWQRELVATRRIVAWAQANLRPFDFHEAVCQMPQGCAIPDMTMLAPFLAAVCVHYRDIGKTWSGEDYGTNGRADFHMREAARFCLFTERTGVELPALHWPEPGAARPKAAIRAALGEPLWSLSWSCRMPTPEGECGVCHACLERATA